MAIQLKEGRSASDLSYARIGYKNVLTSAVETGAEALLIPNTYERLVLASGTQSVRLRPATASTIDYIAIGAHNLKTAGVTSIKFEVTQTIGSSYVEVDNVVPVNDKPIMILLDPQNSITEIRLTFTGGTNRELALVYAGEALVMQRAIFGGHSPVTLNGKTELRNAESDSGQFLGRRIKRKGASATFGFSNLTDDWVRDKFMPFVESAKTTPFFIKWRPDFYSDEVALAHTTNDITISNQSGTVRMLQANMSIRAHDE